MRKSFELYEVRLSPSSFETLKVQIPTFEQKVKLALVTSLAPSHKKRSPSKKTFSFLCCVPTLSMCHVIVIINIKTNPQKM